MSESGKKIGRGSEKPVDLWEKWGASFAGKKKEGVYEFL